MHLEMKIREVRKEKNMTLSGLSRKSGVSASHLSDIENNIKNPSLLVAVKIAKALDVQITQLYNVKW